MKATKAYIKSMRLKKLKRIFFFVPVCTCLFLLSIIRDMFFHKIKSYSQKKKRDRLDCIAQQLYSVIRNPYKFQYGSIWIPQYYLPTNTRCQHHLAPSSGMIQQLQKVRDMPSGECIRLDLSTKSMDQFAD